jgi:hypothetical protein
VINSPLTFAKHWPNANVEGENQLIDFSTKNKPTFLSLYHGDFEKVGKQLAPITSNFKDFTLLSNIPYGY